MLNNIEAKQRFVLARQGRRNDIVNFSLQWPLFIVTGEDVLDEQGIKIVNSDIPHRLQHHPRAERVTAANLPNIPATRQHFGHEFITREQKSKPTRIVIPDLVGHEPERSKPNRISQFETAIILGFSRLFSRLGRYYFLPIVCVLDMRSDLSVRDYRCVDGQPQDKARYVTTSGRAPGCPPRIQIANE